MKTTIEIEGTDTVVVVRKGNIEDEKSDIILNWVGTDMRSGPRSFYNIHKKAGPQLFNYTVAFTGAKETDAFITSPALLDCRLVVHAIMPVVKNAYIKTFYNIAETIKAYKSKHLARSISVYIPEQPDVCLAGIKTFLLDVGLKEVVILYLNDNELNKIKSFLTPFKKRYTLWRRMDRAIIKGLIDLYSWLSTIKNSWEAKRRARNSSSS